MVPGWFQVVPERSQVVPGWFQVVPVWFQVVPGLWWFQGGARAVPSGSQVVPGGSQVVPGLLRCPWQAPVAEEDEPPVLNVQPTRGDFDKLVKAALSQWFYKGTMVVPRWFQGFQGGCRVVPERSQVVPGWFQGGGWFQEGSRIPGGSRWFQVIPRWFQGGSRLARARVRRFT